MYDYRRMTPQERADVVASRKKSERPWHSPPHFEQQESTFLITAACYEHRPILNTAERRDHWVQTLRQIEIALDARLHAWAVLPNHYHLLTTVNLATLRTWLSRRHNAAASRWNREDQTPGRKVWFRFTDRHIRSDGHYFAALNYLHINPVKHGWCERAEAWAWTSLCDYLENVGREELRTWWREYPPDAMGAGWDD